MAERARRDDRSKSGRDDRSRSSGRPRSERDGSRSRGDDRDRGKPVVRDDRSKRSDRYERSNAGDRNDRPERDWDDGLGDIDVNILPRDVIMDLQSLKGGVRVKVERLLAAARIELEEDPEKAYELALQAGKLGGRSPVVREAVGICAYSVGDYKQARLELQAAIRMGGSSDLLPILADSERGLGRPEKAVELLSSKEAEGLEGPAAAERILVLSGARLDQGQTTSAIALLRPAARSVKLSEPWAARLIYGYADALLISGNPEQAREEFMRCAGLDEFGETDATDRLDEIDGVSSRTDDEIE